jgi:hypothetical protein
MAKNTMIIIFLSFFVMCLVKVLRQMKNNVGELLYSQMAIIMAVLCFALTFYNSSLRTEIGYVVYFILALPFINRPVPEKAQNSLE